MAEGRVTEQHGFEATNYAQTAADVLDQAAEKILVATGTEGSPIAPQEQWLRPGERIHTGSSPLNIDESEEAWRQWAGDDFDTLANLPPSSDPSVVPFGQPPPGWREEGGRGGGAVGPTAQDMMGGGDMRTAGQESNLASAGAEVKDFLAAARYTGQREDRTDAGSRARIDAQGLGLPGTLQGQQELRGGGPASAPIVPENLPGGNYTEAETWEPGPTGPPPGWRESPSDAHPESMARGEAQSLFASPASEQGGLAAMGESLKAAVVDLLEKMKGYSLSPEEFADITSMSPDQLTEVYNNLARQQGRTIHPDPQAWNLMGREPFQSPESAAIFQGRVPVSENVIRPGESEYSQWNIPSRQTDPGFMAQDYAQAQAGTTDFMRQIYPWARNLPENVLQRAIQDGDYLRMLIQKAEAGEILPLM